MFICFHKNYMTFRDHICHVSTPSSKFNMNNYFKNINNMVPESLATIRHSIIIFTLFHNTIIIYIKHTPIKSPFLHFRQLS